MISIPTGTLRLSAGGALPAHVVWDHYTQPKWWPQWAPHIRHVDYAHPVVTAGTVGRVRGVGGISAEFRIDDVDAVERRWSWSVRSGPLRLSFEHGVDAAGDGHASVAWLVVRGAWPVILCYAPIARYCLGRLVSPDPS